MDLLEVWDAWSMARAGAESGLKVSTPSGTEYDGADPTFLLEYDVEVARLGEQALEALWQMRRQGLLDMLFASADTQELVQQSDHYSD